MNEHLIRTDDNAEFETKALHTRLKRGALRENSTPLFLNSGHAFHSVAHAQGLFAGTEDDFVYGRWENPNTLEYVQKLCALEGYEDGIATATGMAAVTATFLSFLSSGDHLVYCSAIFGTTYQLIQSVLPRWNISATPVAAQAPEHVWLEACGPSTKMLYVETPSNPGLEVLDLRMLCKVAHAHDALLCVDNCFATPYLQNPRKWGADITLHSATKFIDGQGRVMGGAVLASRAHIAPVRHFAKISGPALSAFHAWILSKSLETLALRMEKHCENAAILAEYLSQHPKIASVCYPFHQSHRGYQLARKQMLKGGGMVSFTLKGGYEAGRILVETLNLFSFTANLGDSKTIVTHPASTTHSKLSPEERASTGVSDGMIRVSVGLEHSSDIIAEFEEILSALDS